MCSVEKPLADFYRDRNSKDGHQRRCKTCHREWWKAYSSDYRRERIKRDPDWVKRVNEIGREATKRWEDRNPDKVRDKSRRTAQRRSSDPLLRAKYTRYQRERRQQRQRNDPAYHAHLMRLARAGWKRRRALLARASGSHTMAEWDRLCAYYDHCCVCCKEHRPLTVDHVVPLSRGGGDGIQNIQPLCGPCNSSKGNRRIIDYRPTLPSWLARSE